jgi:hypothetical protein
MKNCWLICSFLFVLFVSGCTNNEEKQSTTPEEQQPSIEQPSANEPVQPNVNNLSFELLMQLDFIPHEAGTTISLIQDERLYHSWAEIFQFPSVPTIDFTTEEVLFITMYSDGCGRVLDNITKEKDQLVVQLQYPDDLRNQKEIVCTEIAKPITFVVKLEKTNLTHGTLKDVHHLLLENELLIQ